jgi:hypothetical protein
MLPAPPRTPLAPTPASQQRLTPRVCFLQTTIHRLATQPRVPTSNPLQASLLQERDITRTGLILQGMEDNR